MAIKIVKKLAVAEDLELGLGTVEQERDVDGTGSVTGTYTKINASVIPTTDSDIQTDLNNRFTKDEVTTSFAALEGSDTETFNVASPTFGTHAVSRSYLETQLTDNMSEYALKINVLQKDNLVVFVPTADYHPATKKYMDDLVIAAGAGDMVKSIYDVANNGVVDNSEALSGVTLDYIMSNKGIATDCDNRITIGSWECEDANNAPVTGLGILETLEGPTKGILVQTYHSINYELTYIRMHNGTVWSSWVNQSDTVTLNDTLVSTATDEALTANQGRILSENITTVSNSNVPVGGIIMYDGEFNKIPINWKLCDGANGTPNLSDKFIRGTVSEASMGSSGGSDVATMPSHTHTGPSHRHTGPGHTHTGPSHTHTMNHDHPSATTSSAGSHNHTTYGQLILDYITPTINISALDTNFRYGQSGLSSSNGAHTHTLNVADYSGSTGAGGTGNTGSSGTGYTSYHGTGDTGSAGGTGDNKPAYYTLAYIKRVA